jgi:hypothetical protein
VTETELDAVSVWWEEFPYTVRHRLHRMDAHLRQHSVQAAQVVTAACGPMTEAHELARLVWDACGRVEGAAIGAETLVAPQVAPVAQRILARSREVSELAS